MTETDIERHRREYRRNWIILIGIFVSLYLIGSFIFSLNPVEDYTGRWMDFLDPKREERVWKQFEKKTDVELLKLLHHGDSLKSSTAKAILGRRGNPELFDTFLKKLKDPSARVRSMARTLLQVDPERAAKFYMEELQKLPRDSDEYRQTLSILTHMEYEPVFPYLIEYAKLDVGNQHATSVLLEEFGDPSAIPVLEEMLKNMPQPSRPSEENRIEFEKNRIKRAIEKLQALAKVKSGY